jgi:hypothetical protein
MLTNGSGIVHPPTQAALDEAGADHDDPTDMIQPPFTQTPPP